MTAAIKLYGAIALKETRRFFTYRGNIYAGLIGVFFSLGIRYALWAALFSSGNVQSSSLAEVMTFYVINDLFLSLIFKFFGDAIGSDIRSGDIANRLTKPYSYHLHLVAVSYGGSLFALVVSVIPTLVIALCFIGLLPPVSFAAMVCFLVTAILGSIIFMLISFTISYTAFWLIDYWHVGWFFWALFILFGGIKLPLWFYPDWLTAICRILPFQYATYQPMAFYLGRVPASEFGFSVCIQIFWIAVLFLLERFVWRLAQKKLIVQGG